MKNLLILLGCLAVGFLYTWIRGVLGKRNKAMQEVTPLSGNWKKILEFISRDSVFECRLRSDKDDESKCNIRVRNIKYAPADGNEIRKCEKQIGKQLTPSHRKFLSISNGVALFTQERGAKKNLNSGFMLYSSEMIPSSTDEVRQDLQEYLEDGVEADDQQMVENWLKNILVVGEEIGSGNYIIIDYIRPEGNGEYSVAMLNHEIPLSCAFKENTDHILGSSIDSMLLSAFEEPATFLMDRLGSTASYYDDTNENVWWPVKYVGQFNS